MHFIIPFINLEKNLSGNRKIVKLFLLWNNLRRFNYHKSGPTSNHATTDEENSSPHLISSRPKDQRIYLYSLFHWLIHSPPWFIWWYSLSALWPLDAKLGCFCCNSDQLFQYLPNYPDNTWTEHFFSLLDSSVYCGGTDCSWLFIFSYSDAVHWNC